MRLCGCRAESEIFGMRLVFGAVLFRWCADNFAIWLLEELLKGVWDILVFVVGLWIDG